MTRAEKKFDAVAFMRSVRDRISTEIECMTLEEELAWLARQELHDPFLRRLRDSAGGRSAETRMSLGRIAEQREKRS